MEKLKLSAIIGVSILAVIGLCVFGVQSAKNKAIYLYEAIEQAESDIKVQEKARVDKVFNIADCVKQYEKHEYETLTEIAKSMSVGGKQSREHFMFVINKLDAYDEEDDDIYRI